MQLEASGVRFLSEGDERSFFEWLQQIKCVQSVRGEGRSVFITLSKLPADEELRELIGLFFRYDIDMRQLARFAEREWVSNPDAYWHRRVFA